MTQPFHSWYASQRAEVRTLWQSVHPMARSSTAHSGQATEPVRCPSTDERTKTVWYGCTVVFSPDIGDNEILPLASKGALENTMPSGTRQLLGPGANAFSPRWKVERTTQELKRELIKAERRLPGAPWPGGGLSQPLCQVRERSPPHLLAHVWPSLCMSFLTLPKQSGKGSWLRV